MPASVSCGRTDKKKKLKIHARGRIGIQQHVKTNIRFEIKEVPPMPNERRLGRAGWHNETWERFEQSVPEYNQKFDKLRAALLKTGGVYIPKGVLNESSTVVASNDNTSPTASTPIIAEEVQPETVQQPSDKQ